MKTLDNSVLQLAEAIYAGKCSYQKTVSRIAAIEAQYGSIDRNIDYPDCTGQTPQNYMDELIGRVRVGLYSKPLILDLAKASDKLYGVKSTGLKLKKPVIFGVAIIAALAVLAVIVAVSVGE